MSTANFLDQDFGSDSDEGDFNPAPADDSDGAESAADDEEPASIRKSKVAAEHPRRKVREEVYDEDEEEDAEDLNSKPNGRENGDRRADSSDDSDQEAVASSNGTKGPGVGSKRVELDDEDLDEDDEDDEEDDDEEEVSGRPMKRRRRQANQFLDVEAVVDESEEDIDDEEDELVEQEKFIADTHPDDVDRIPAGGDTDDRRHRELDQRRDAEMSLQAEQQAEEFRKRYGRNRVTHAESVIVPQRLLVPDVNDPGIWSVKCKPGKEKEILFAIMKRVEERAHTRQPVQICSAFERGGTMTGHLYIEAEHQSNVMAALEGISNVYPRSQTILVPVKEREALLRTKKSKELELGAYVRVKRGKYAGDLAQVEEIEQNGLEVQVRLIPRLDYGLNEDLNAPMMENGTGGVIKRKRLGGAGGGPNSVAVRPPARLFSEHEAQKKHMRYLNQVPPHDRNHWSYLGDIYEYGFLVKDYKLQLLQTEDVNPTLEEVTKFVSTSGEDGAENLDLSALAASIKDSSFTGSYLPGDTVEVYEGEQQGVYGKAVNVRGDIVKLRVLEGELKGQELEVPQKGLRKRFREGDHVKVIGGSRYKDEVGMVVKISQDRVSILSDLSMQEITVFSKDLREASDSGGAGSLGKYDLHDLVQLDPATVACVIKVDRESLRVLDQNASVRSIMPSQISNKLERRRHAVATDRNGSEIRNEDTVKEIGGEQKQGIIIHVYRSFLFCHNREITENSGIFVVRATNVLTVAAKGGRTVGITGPDLTKMNPSMQRNGAANGDMAPPKSFGRDRAIGQTVTIRKGPHKSLLGIVKDTTDTEARVELHTKSKTITVPKDTLSFKDPATGQSRSYADFASGGRGRGRGRGRGDSSGGMSRTPQDWQGGNRTPIAASPMRTPAWGSGGRTPAWNAGGDHGGRTPAWKQDAAGGRTPAWAGAEGSRTVNPYSEGSRTAYGGASGRTPAWNASSRTPYGGSDAFSSGTSDPWAGSKTPAYGASSSTNDAWGSRTPAHTSHDAFPSGPKTPSHDIWGSAGRYDAPTPGGDPLSAPTPGALNAPTPGLYNAPTPAATAPTPHSWAGTGGAGGAGAGGWNDGMVQTPGARGAPTPGAYGGPETPGIWAGDDDGGPRYSSRSPSP